MKVRAQRRFGVFVKFEKLNGHARLHAILPESGRPFDAALHQLFDQTTPPTGSIVGDIIAPGYSFQGQQIRLPVVALQESKTPAPKEDTAQLSFDQAPA